VLAPLDAEPEPASLRELRARVTALLPEVEIADLPLEVHAWTGFLHEYTHISGTEQDTDPTPLETLSALLVSESCNVGLTPVANENYPPLRRNRLNWVAHNYLRSATHADAKPARTTTTPRCRWPKPRAVGKWPPPTGCASSSVATIHAAYNPRYFGRQRGSTLVFLAG
jgi:Tn3 transposase DDE domain